jgi:hypothetical protein
MSLLCTTCASFKIYLIICKIPGSQSSGYVFRIRTLCSPLNFNWVLEECHLHLQELKVCQLRSQHITQMTELIILLLSSHPSLDFLNNIWWREVIITKALRILAFPSLKWWKRIVLCTEKPSVLLLLEGVNCLVKKKGKTISVTGHKGLWGCEMTRIPHCLDNQLSDGI